MFSYTFFLKKQTNCTLAIGSCALRLNRSWKQDPDLKVLWPLSCSSLRAADSFSPKEALSNHTTSVRSSGAAFAAASNERNSDATWGRSRSASLVGHGGAILNDQ